MHNGNGTHVDAPTESKIVILGAGPTGLGAGYRLQELGYRNFDMYERNPYVGGLATSFQDEAGFTYDIGGHVMFSHYEYFDKLVDKLLGDDYTEIMREAWVWMMDRFVPYPFQNNIRYLPPEVVLECVLGLIESQKNPDALKAAQNFDQLIDAQFGKGIARHFMKPYNFKVWAHPVSHMSIDWLGERVSLPNLDQILKNVIMGQDSVSWGPNNKFKYPMYGGTGGLYTPFMRYVGDHVHLNRAATTIDAEAKTITFSDGEIVAYDKLLSTMPLDLLVTRLVNAPEAVQAAIHHLHHSSGLIVGVGVKRPAETSKCWLYFPEPVSPFYRVTYLNNYSPHMTPDADNYHLLLSETSYSRYKPEDKSTIVDRVVQGLINTKILREDDLDLIASTYVIDVDYSYPVPTVDRNLALGVIHDYLMERGIYSRGRFGAWEYEIGNMDHSVMQGVELVNHWLYDEAETTWRDFRPLAQSVINVQTNGKAHTNGNGAHDDDTIQVFTSTPGHGYVQAGSQRLTQPSLMRPILEKASGLD